MSKTKLLIAGSILLVGIVGFLSINSVFKYRFTKYVEEELYDLGASTNCVVNGFSETFNTFDKLKFIVSGELDRDAKKAPYMLTIMIGCGAGF